MVKYNQLSFNGDSLVVEVTDGNVYFEHTDTQWCTVLRHDQLEEVYKFYTEVKPELKPTEPRMVAFVMDKDGYPIDKQHASQEAIGSAVKKLQKRHSDKDCTIEVEMA